MPEATLKTLDANALLAALAEKQAALAAAKDKETRTRKDVEVLTKRADKEAGVVVAAQKELDSVQAELVARLSKK